MSLFELTTEEKLSVTEDIHELLLEAVSLLDSGRQNSVVDYAEALRLVKQALMLATDPDACECPPLARCYLIKGFILQDLGKDQEAHDAYRMASEAEPHDIYDEEAVQEAADLFAISANTYRQQKRQCGIWRDHEVEPNSQRRFPLVNAEYSPILRVLGLQTEFWDPEPPVKVHRGAFRERPTIVYPDF
ncbi:hypothetical protein F4780DRAFT_779688 [Xylariomycetidae sp. FL0641]|nr:hypothetical protein F4780DRAFT_779688 [Xylariomycetidae sp. FL0641]